MNAGLIIASAVTLFFVLDPLGNMPVFHALLDPFPTRRKQKIILRESLFALGILLAALFAGKQMLQLLGLQTPTLNLAGGILLFVIAIRMVFPNTSESAIATPAAVEPYLVPMATPLFVGPSTLAFVLLESANGHLLQNLLVVLLAWGAAALILIASPFFWHLIDQRIARATERLLGMLLILMAVQMILNGIGDYYLLLLEKAGGG